MNIRDIAQKVKGYIQSKTQDDEGWVRQGKFTPVQQVQDIKTDLRANIAYGQAKVAQTFAPKYQIPTYQQQDSYYKSPIGQFENKNWSALEGLQKPVEKSFSAQINPYPVVQKTPANIQLEQQKQQILNSGAFRPAMARYLSTIPVNASVELDKGSGMTFTSGKQNYRQIPNDINTWETSQGTLQPDITIGIDEKNKKTQFNTVIPSMQENLNPVLAHELIHAAPRNMKYKDQFQKLYEGLTPQSNPVLFNSASTYLMNGQKPPNAEELYATLAQNLGTNVLNIPEVRKFYENLFK